MKKEDIRKNIIKDIKMFGRIEDEGGSFKAVNPYWIIRCVNKHFEVKE